MVDKILVVDDEEDMLSLLDRVLSKQGYEVVCANSAREGLRQTYRLQPDLILLDIMMSEMDGWEMLRRLREFSDVPVIMLTAVVGTDNKVQGLDIGADDYVTKPFEVRELLARIRSTLRRAAASADDMDQDLSFDQGRLIIEPVARKVSVQGKVISLTPTEYRLLLYLAVNAGQVLSYDQILQHVWGPGYEDSISNVKVYIRRLRTKIEPDSTEPRHILTEWGIGYSMAKI